HTRFSRDWSSDVCSSDLDIAVVKQPASDADRRVGTLFAAAGGPGDSGLDWARRGPLFTGEISRRFDIVTFDQRGVGASAPVKCFADEAEQVRFWQNLALPPRTAEEQAASALAGRVYAEGCARHSGELLAKDRKSTRLNSSHVK